MGKVRKKNRASLGGVAHGNSLGKVEMGEYSLTSSKGGPRKYTDVISVS